MPVFWFVSRYLTGYYNQTHGIRNRFFQHSNIQAGPVKAAGINGKRPKAKTDAACTEIV